MAMAHLYTHTLDIHTFALSYLHARPSHRCFRLVCLQMLADAAQLSCVNHGAPEASILAAAAAVHRSSGSWRRQPVTSCRSAGAKNFHGQHAAWSPSTYCLYLASSSEATVHGKQACSITKSSTPNENMSCAVSAIASPLCATYLGKKRERKKIGMNAVCFVLLSFFLYFLFFLLACTHQLGGGVCARAAAKVWHHALVRQHLKVAQLGHAAAGQQDILERQRKRRKYKKPTTSLCIKIYIFSSPLTSGLMSECTSSRLCR